MALREDSLEDRRFLDDDDDDDDDAGTGATCVGLERSMLLPLLFFWRCMVVIKPQVSASFHMLSLCVFGVAASKSWKITGRQLLTRRLSKTAFEGERASVRTCTHVHVRMCVRVRVCVWVSL